MDEERRNLDRLNELLGIDEWGFGLTINGDALVGYPEGQKTYLDCEECRELSVLFEWLYYQMKDARDG